MSDQEFRDDRPSLREVTTALKSLSEYHAPSLGIDLDGTIDESPYFFNALTYVWPGKVFVITYRDDLEKAKADLARYHIRYDDVVLVKTFAEKAEVISRLGISIFIDDQDEILQHIPPNVTVLKLRNGGNFDYEAKKWLFSEDTGRLI